MEEHKSGNKFDEEKKKTEREGSLKTDSEQKERKEKENLTDKVRENPWIATTIMLGVLTLILIIGNFTNFTGSIITGGTIGVSESSAAKALNKFIEIKTNGEAKLLQIQKYNDFLYEATIELQGNKIPLYITKDGKYLVQGITSLEIQAPSASSTEVPKSDKPNVELAITSHCPYGLQGTKGILPVYELLGDKIDSSIRYFNIPSHGEKEEIEAKRAVCIREQQRDKLFDYLACYVEAGESENCLKEAKVDETKLNSCLTNDIGDYYSGTSEIGLGVSSSPTLIINGVQLDSGRSPAAYLATICNAFTEGNQPEACNEELNSASPSPGFGYTASAGGSTNAQC